MKIPLRPPGRDAAVAARDAAAAARDAAVAARDAAAAARDAAVAARDAAVAARDAAAAAGDTRPNRDTCLGGSLVYPRLGQRVEECGIPPRKPQHGPARGPRTVRGVLGQQVLLTGVVAGEPPPLPRWSGPGHNGPLEAGPEYTLLHKEGLISLLIRRSAEPQEHVDEQQRLVEARQVDFRKLPAPHGPPGQKTPAPNEPPSLKTPAPLPPPPMAFRANLKGSGVKPRPEEEKKGPQQVDFRSILGKKTTPKKEVENTPKKEVENTPKNGEKEAKNCVDAGRGGGGGAGAPDFKQKLSNINVLDGQKLRLQCCLLTADLRDVKVTWTLDGKVIKPSKFIVLASEGGLCSLTIEKALPEDEGQYKCRVETSLGKTETSCMVLVDDPEDSTLADRKKNSGPASESEARIKKPTTKTPPKQALPPQILQFPEDMKILAGEKVEISCRFSGAPPFSCTWLKFRKPIQQGAGGVSIESSDSSSQLIIASGQQEHCGCYTIELKNSYGLRQAALNLTIVDKPDPPAKVPAVSDVRRSTLTLSWYGPTYDGGSAVQSYNLEVWDSLGSQWRALGSCNSTSYNVQNLLPERQYKFRVRAVNIYGVGEPSVESIPVTVGLVADDGESCFTRFN
ncbi:myosin light chain kinase, smooth muscle-like [Gadus chalcogrammus]|uniref:myosin light chain kinase, smooth muscle-like n=1 Tax=Gadus chalcogrammus TaxID=1042646 RepID=UPI0024C4AE4B|nr:myosin light chain kinase, smooth muscle-like [Gadus chalcogrammus]